MAKYFGTDGIRGKANEALSPELALRLGKAAALLALDGENKRILIGKDTRVSCDMLEAALAAGLMSCGVDVMLLGVIPTPGVAALCREYDAPGVVISASHNPYYDNGIKFFTANGLKLPDAMQDNIEERLDAPQLVEVEALRMGRLITVRQAAERYMEILLAAQQPNLAGLKLVVDSSNGAAASIAGDLLRRLGATVIEIGYQPDGYNINEGCGSTHPQLLQATVVEQEADLGLALDGDADRLQAVDERGNLLDGDIMLTIMALHMKKNGCLKNNSVVITQMCNMGLRQTLLGQGVDIAESKVGDRYVLEKMFETGACLGGEQSGHLILQRYNSTGDGLAAALYLLSILVDSGAERSLSGLTTGLQTYPQVQKNVPVKDKQGFATDAEISAAIAAAEQELAGQGRVVVRPSGTEPLFRVMTEGPDEATLQRLSNDIAGIISRKLG